MCEFTLNVTPVDSFFVREFAKARCCMELGPRVVSKCSFCLTVWRTHTHSSSRDGSELSESQFLKAKKQTTKELTRTWSPLGVSFDPQIDTKSIDPH